jgi:hypothetical protein
MFTKIFKQTNLINICSKGFRIKSGYDRENFPDNRIRTGIEVSPYNPQFTLTEEERIGITLITNSK